jgi:hypothetical protein
MSEVAADTIDYVATDPTGLTATSTRTIVIDPATLRSSPPPIAASSTPDVIASSTAAAVATSTAQ